MLYFGNSDCPLSVREKVGFNSYVELGKAGKPVMPLIFRVLTLSKGLGSYGPRNGLNRKVEFI
jgi:hypothetical protein